MKPAYENFEHALLFLLKEAKAGPVSIHTFLVTLSGRGKIFLLLFLSLGFAQIPGISVVLGFFIAYLGLRIAIGGSFIWVPKSLLHKKLPSFFLKKIIKQMLQALKFMKRWSRQRYEWATKKTTARILCGVVIALVGIGIASCPPLPLTGIPACLAIFLITIGLLNNDGIYIIFGYIVSFFYLIEVSLLLIHLPFTQILKWIMQKF